MKLKELLQKLVATQEEIKAHPAFICGGTPRDKYMGRLENVADIDITNGEKDIDYISQQFFFKMRKDYNVTRKVMPDGHSTLFVGSLKIDFSSNFIVPGIDEQLAKMGVKDPTNLVREMYSRDFTCNALLLTPDLKKLLDPTKRGFKDIDNKLIVCCLSPEITLTSNRNRVIRAIYLACKLGFEIDSSIISYVKAHPEVSKISTNKVMAEKTNEAFTRDPEKAFKLITEMGLWNYIPITKKAYPFYQRFLKGTK